jgi:outer membrane protein OmpA-like peptidoglycan-associated protein
MSPPAAPSPAPPPAVRPSAPDVVTLPYEDHQQGIARRLQALATGGAERLRPDEVGYYMDVQQARLQQVGRDLVSVKRDGTRLIITLVGGPSFEVGRDRLTADASVSLTVLAGILAEYRLTLVSVHGHTDASGAATSNQQLSEQRSLAVARWLLARGVSLDRLVAVGHGQADPVASNDTPEGRDRNRRVELHLDPIVGPPTDSRR